MEVTSILNTTKDLKIRLVAGKTVASSGWWLRITVSDKIFKHHKFVDARGYKTGYPRTYSFLKEGIDSKRHSLNFLPLSLFRLSLLPLFG